MAVRLALTGLLIAVIATLVFFYLELGEVKNSQKSDQITQMETKQFLLSTINWSTQRQKLLLYMRDVIVKEEIRIGLKPNYDRAFDKSNLIIMESERYPGLQPLLLLAVQNIESAFNDSAVSVMGAMGEWQFVPSTAMLLCNALSITFSDKAYYDPICTRLVGKYFDVLKASYKTEEEALADYNGGPKQAFLYKVNKAKLDPETSAFVVNVMSKQAEYTKGFESYRVDDKLISNPDIRPDSVLASQKTKAPVKRRRSR